MKIIKTFTLGVVLMLALATGALAQSVPTITVLSSAITTTAQSQLVVASTAGMTASTASLQSFILIDSELMKVNSLSPFLVTRGQGGTAQTLHNNGSMVVWGHMANLDPQTGVVGGGPATVPIFLTRNSIPTGTCTRASQTYLPIFNPANGKAYNCLGMTVGTAGTTAVTAWQEQTLLDVGRNVPTRVCVYPKNLVALVSAGTDVIPGTAGNIYLTSFENPTSRYLNGVSANFGVTVGSASGWVAGIYDAAGKLLFNSTTGGTTVGTASVFKDFPVVTPGLLTGPARYYLFVQNKGTTDGVRIVVATPDVFSGIVAGTFGTLPAVTVPTANTASTAVVSCAY